MTIGWIMAAVGFAFFVYSIVGFVLVRVAADEAEILTIAVRREARGRGHVFRRVLDRQRVGRRRR